MGPFTAIRLSDYWTSLHWRNRNSTGSPRPTMWGEWPFNPYPDTGHTRGVITSARIIGIYWQELPPQDMRKLTPHLTSGTPTFLIPQPVHGLCNSKIRLYFANTINELVYLEGSQWYIYTTLPIPLPIPPLLKLVQQRVQSLVLSICLVQRMWEYTRFPSCWSWCHKLLVLGGLILCLIHSVITTYLTITVPSAPAGCKNVGIFRSNEIGEAFYLDKIRGNANHLW